jgi:hypothetical protein
MPSPTEGKRRRHLHHHDVNRDGTLILQLTTVEGERMPLRTSARRCIDVAAEPLQAVHAGIAKMR